ncbi:hypothetical protein Pmar_PMAR021850 [Perkinsus marinus ATCC 50983]|uniref:Uncharacterized protein n=1 Tax=Perkinsus marinus (strain ATCC 50983 / TXsc) TaxID=423536 RepID=C5KSL1_PERM5|nr:hypothetical protein Pmar_PMAR021850 [Perkinsus marinus ATCC 50983]EER12532.1 hypothetical protein Pmar_PMAR021850 [Perkinsus marinus ATCC 50983]|eukprot:XP_002780737.1 hypothetical protein Pmar_PMAR021850 [Perkinsus marinus ATCC 50983]
MARFILTRGFSLLAPQLAVLYVFYWVDRRLHASFRYNWDIDLSMGDTVCLPPPPTPFAAGTVGEPSFGFAETAAESPYWSEGSGRIPLLERKKVTCDEGDIVNPLEPLKNQQD